MEELFAEIVQRRHRESNKILLMGGNGMRLIINLIPLCFQIRSLGIVKREFSSRSAIKMFHCLFPMDIAE